MSAGAIHPRTFDTDTQLWLCHHLAPQMLSGAWTNERWPPAYAQGQAVEQSEIAQHPTDWYMVTRI